MQYVHAIGLKYKICVMNSHYFKMWGDSHPSWLPGCLSVAPFILRKLHILVVIVSMYILLICLLCILSFIGIFVVMLTVHIKPVIHVESLNMGDHVTTYIASVLYYPWPLINISYTTVSAVFMSDKG